MIRVGSNGDVLSDCVVGPMAPHTLWKGESSPGVDVANDAASGHDVHGRLANEILDVFLQGQR